MADDLVTVRTFQFLPEADAAQMHLAAAGIPAYITDGQIVNADWFLGNATGYIKLQVATSHAEAALEALDLFPPSGSAADSESSDESRCLACGELLPPGTATCDACGWSFAATEEGGPEDEESADAETVSSTPRVMHTLRSWKRPFLMLMLAPIFVWAALIVVQIVEWLLSLAFD